jgi:signal recognition particle GTPase
MVLGDLGRKITTALQKFSRSTVIDENAIKECLGEISNALLAADVSVKFVFKMR